MQPVRRGAEALYRYLTPIFFLGVVVQFLLAGAGVFGQKIGVKLEDQTSFDPHRTLGDILLAGSLVLFVLVLVSWPADRRIIGPYGGLFVLMIVQFFLADPDHRWVGAFHPVVGLAVFGLSGWLAGHQMRRSATATAEAGPAASVRSG